jgi:hypothetical protein
MTVSGHDWRHPGSYQEARARLIGRQRLNAARRYYVGQVCDDLVLPRLLAYGFDSWGVCARIAREIGVSRASVCRYRQRIVRAMLGL